MRSVLNFCTEHIKHIPNINKNIWDIICILNGNNLNNLNLLRVFALNYNILRILSGMDGLAFSS